MMSDLESLREIFKDTRMHVGVGVITQLGLANDKTVLRVQVNLLPDQRQVICLMSFADVYDVTFPELNDLVLVGFADGHPDDAHVIARFNSDEEPIPAFAATGDSVKYARPTKKMYLGSDTKVGIARPNHDATNPLVLGDILQTFLTNIVNAILNASQIGFSPSGPVFLDPGIRTALTTNLQNLVTTASTNFLSQIGFTERGA